MWLFLYLPFIGASQEQYHSHTGKFTMQDQFFQENHYFSLDADQVVQFGHQKTLSIVQYNVPSIHCEVNTAMDSKSVWASPRPPDDCNDNSFCIHPSTRQFYSRDGNSLCNAFGVSFLEVIPLIKQQHLPSYCRFADRLPTVSTCRKGCVSCNGVTQDRVPYFCHVVQESLQSNHSCSVFRRLLPYGFLRSSTMQDHLIKHDQLLEFVNVNLYKKSHGHLTTAECMCQNTDEHVSGSEWRGGVFRYPSNPNQIVCGKSGFVHKQVNESQQLFHERSIKDQGFECVFREDRPLKDIHGTWCRFSTDHIGKFEHSWSHICSLCWKCMDRYDVKSIYHDAIMYPCCSSRHACYKQSYMECELTNKCEWCVLRFKVSFTKADDSMHILTNEPSNMHHQNAYQQFSQCRLCQYARLNHHNFITIILIICLNLPWTFSQWILVCLSRGKKETWVCGRRTIFQCRKIQRIRTRHLRRNQHAITRIQVVSSLTISCRILQDIFSKCPHAWQPSPCYDTRIQESKTISIVIIAALPSSSLNAGVSNSIRQHLGGFACTGINQDHNNQDKSKQYRRRAYAGQRVGEADNPGPSLLDIGTFNPTQLLHKEDDILAWGQGIYCASETSVTTAALKLLRPKFARTKFHCVWSDPVEPIQPKRSQLRGKASGVAIISTFPIRQYHEPITHPVQDTSRFVDGVIQISANCAIYAASLYGVASSSIALDPIAITNQLFNFAAERAMAFKGPAMIAGDLNCYLSDIGVWGTMVHHGWFDAAELDGRIFNREPQPTSKDKVRKSFILMNKQMAATLANCRTCEDHLFPTHPLLLAQCSMDSILSPSLQWTLPKSVDALIFDPDLMEETAINLTQTHEHKFAKALDDDPDHAASLFAMAVEASWKKACVDSEGNSQIIQPGFFGRDKLNPLKMQPPTVPIVRKARDGDFEPKLAQPSVGIRRHTRQLRRLESLLAQTKALHSHHSNAHNKCQQLWEAILKATGFRKSFAFWMCENFQFFVPLTLPPPNYINELLSVF